MCGWSDDTCPGSSRPPRRAPRGIAIPHFHEAALVILPDTWIYLFDRLQTETKLRCFRLAHELPCLRPPVGGVGEFLRQRVRLAIDPAWGAKGSIN